MRYKTPPCNGWTCTSLAPSAACTLAITLPKLAHPARSQKSAATLERTCSLTTTRPMRTTVHKRACTCCCSIGGSAIPGACLQISALRLCLISAHTVAACMHVLSCQVTKAQLCPRDMPHACMMQRRTTAKMHRKAQLSTDRRLAGAVCIIQTSLWCKTG